MYGWTVSLKNKPGKQRKVSFEKILTTFKKPNLIETDDDIESVSKNFYRIFGIEKINS